MMKVLFILNSDLGVRNTIGARAYPIAKAIKNEDLIVFCRGYEKSISGYDVREVVPAGKLIMKTLTAIPIYISKKIDTNPAKIAIFESFLIRKLKKIDLGAIDLVHSWDYLPKAYAFIKSINPDIKILQDVPIALPNIIAGMKDKEELWKGEKLSISDEFKQADKFIDIFIAPSDFVKDSLKLFGIKESRIAVIPFGADIKKFKPIRRDLKGTFRCCFAGNVNNRKGIKYLVDAWEQLNLKDAELNIYGRIYPESGCYFKDSSLYGIRCHGFVDVAKELAKNHVYVFPSLMEGSSKSVYEAMACGLPVITTRNAGSIIEDGREGFIVPIQDEKALKDKISYFYNDRKQISSFGRRARIKVERYTWEDYAKKIISTYRKNI